MNEILISIKPDFVEKILCGEKTVELRTRRVNVQPGTKMWIYSTLPKGEICALAQVEYVYTDQPDLIWKKYSSEIAISSEEYWEYVGNKDAVTIIKMGDVDSLEQGVTLQSIKKKISSFNPPQFFIRLQQNNPIRSLLHQAA